MQEPGLNQDDRQEKHRHRRESQDNHRNAGVGEQAKGLLIHSQIALITGYCSLCFCASVCERFLPQSRRHLPARDDVGDPGEVLIHYTVFLKFRRDGPNRRVRLLQAF